MSMPYVNIMEELEGIPWKIAWPSKTRFNPWSTQIWSNSKNLSVVIRSIKDKGSTRSSFRLSFDHKCFHSWICFLRNVNLALMLACAWNKWTCVSNILSFWISLMFLKRNKFYDHKVRAKNENENVFQMFDFGSWNNWWLLLVINPSW